MFVKDIITEVNSLADDQLTDAELISFINQALNEIGMKVKATFPSIPSVGYEYQEPALPDKWVQNLILPFAKGRVKEKDSSQFEWEVGYDTFITNLENFLVQYEVPLAYKDLPRGLELETTNGTYKTNSGDTLYQIARSTRTDVSELEGQVTDKNGKLIFHDGDSTPTSVFSNPPWYGGAW